MQAQSLDGPRGKIVRINSDGTIPTNISRTGKDYGWPTIASGLE